MRLTRRGFMYRGAAGLACGLGAIIGLPALRGKPTSALASYRITTNDLKLAGLHQHQLNRFAEKTGGVLEFEWTLEEQIKRIQGPLSCCFFFMMHRQIIPMWNMAGANLAGAGLCHVNWPGIDLRGTNLEGANLQDAHLQSAQLQGANLKGANLVWALMKSSDLTDANLEGANLENATLHDAHLVCTNLAKANLRYASLGGALLQNANLQGADMFMTNLWEANLPGADLRNAHWLMGHYLLEAGSLSFTKLQGCHLSEEEAAEAQERGAIL